MGPVFWKRCASSFFLARQNLAWSNRLMENRLAMAEQLNEVAHIMQMAAEDIYNIAGVPSQLEGQARRVLKKIHVVVKKMWTLEKTRGQKKSICHPPGERRTVRYGREVARKLSEVYDLRLVPARESRKCAEQRIQHRAVYGGYQLPCPLQRGKDYQRKRETVSGDSYACCDGGGSLVLCLSDGMGSGLAANRESEAVVDLLEEFITSGFSKETAAKMINSALVLQQNDGMFSTVDVCSLDLYTGVCNFLKAGAASTFIRRDQWVETTFVPPAMAAGLIQQAGL